MDVFDLVAKLTLDSSGFEDGLNDSQKKANTIGGKIGTAVKTAGKVGAAAFTAVATASAAFGTAIVKNAGETAAYGDNIDKMSQKMGMSAEAYQEWDAIMQHSGTSIESMQASMKTLANAVENGNDAFERLGISQEEIANMSQEELFAATISGLQNVENETERTYLAGQLLGRGATELGALLNTSAEDTEAMRRRVHELGGVMSDEAVKASAKYQDSLQDMQTAFAGLKRGLVSDLLPGITTVMDGLTELFSGNSDSGIALISDGLDGLVKSISEKLPEFISVGTEIIGALTDALIENMPMIIESGTQLLIQLIVGVLAALPKLVEAIPDIIDAMVNGFVNAWPELKQAGVDLLKKVWEGIKEQLGPFVEDVKTIWESTKEMTAEMWESIKTAVTDKIDALKTGVVEKFENVKKAISDIIEKIKGIFDFSWDFPKPKLPHFTVEWRDLGILSIPDVSIEWYKKAYDNPYMFNKPTVMGFGDGVGGEMVYGHNSLLNDIKTAMQTVIGNEQPTTIIVQSVLDGRVIGETATKWQRRQARAFG